MFDKLVESTKSKSNRRGGRIFFLTGVFYALLLSTLAVWTILGLNPGLAESFDLTKLPSVPVAPSIPVQPQPLTAALRPAAVVVTTFTPPTRAVTIPDAAKLGELKPVVFGRPGVPGGQACPDCPGGLPAGLFGGKVGDAPPPPILEKPKPPEPPETKPTPEKPHKVSIGVLQGAAIRKVSPQYPAMAKAVRADGAVQIQVTISEEGQVLEAAVLNGHPLLRQAALDAARQWVFRPTLLSNVPVKVQGILTFNFTLN